MPAHSALFHGSFEEEVKMSLAESLRRANKKAGE